MTLQELVTRYSFDIDTKPLDQANEKLENLVGFATKIGLSVAAAAGTLFGFAKSAADAGDEAVKAAQKFGLTAEAYQELMYAARGEANDLKTGLLFLNKAIDGANGGAKEQSAAFKKLGVSYKDARGNLRSTDEVLMDVVGSFNKLKDGPKKVGLAMDLFGKSGANLIPFLNQSREEIQALREEAIATGYVLSGEALKDAEKFNDSLDDLINTGKGLVNTIGAGLMPMISGLVKRFQQWVIANRAMIKTKIDQFFVTLTKYIERAVKLGTALYNVVSGLTRVFGGLENTISLAATALLIFAGAKVLYGIGQLAMSIGNLAKMFTLANAAALAIPIAIGAAIVIIGLMIEDIYQFFTGGESVLGTWVEAFKLIFSYIGEIATGFLSDLKNSFIQWGKDVVGWIVGLFKPFIDMLSNFGNFASNGIKGMNLKGISDSIAQAVRGPSFGTSPSSSPATSMASNQNQSNRIQVNNTITVGPGTDVAEVERRVEAGTSGGLDKSLRGAERAFGKGTY